MNKYIFAFAFACIAAFSPAADNTLSPDNTFPALGAPEDPKVQIAWNRFYDVKGLHDQMRALNAAYPGLSKIVVLGKSVEGRDLLAIEISNPAKGDPLAKPAMYIDGNIHGNEVQAGETVLYTAWYLLEMYGKVELVTKLVDERTFYLVPTENPDGRDGWFNEAHNAHSSRGGRVPLDSDGDGLEDEDGPEDLDGDGQITRMRIKDPFGRMKVDPDFPDYLMVEAKPDERGEYRMLDEEGIDNDGDGQINEDGPGGYDPNRNWPFDWAPQSVQYGAMDYPFSLPETRAVRDYVLARPNIAGAQSYHNNGGMILRAPGREGAKVFRGDDRAMSQIAERGAEMIPYYRNMVIYKDLYTVWGGQVDWFYAARGVSAFTNELWTEQNLFKRAGEGGEGGRRDRAMFIRRLLMEQGLTKWHEIDHPTYGKVEVGGMSKNWGRVPPSFLLEEELHRNMMFTLYHAESLPALRAGETDVEALGDGVFRVRHAIENHGYLASRLQVDVERNLTPDNTVTITGTGVKVLASGIVEDPDFGKVKWQKDRPEILRVKTVPGMRRLFVEFLVQGSSDAKIEVRSMRGGNYDAPIELKDERK